MKYIWEPLIWMEQRGIPLTDAHYTVRNNWVSPYLELQTENLYGELGMKEFLSHMEVNPYLRFHKIFTPFINPEDEGYSLFQDGLADVILHMLADVDRKAGMNKREWRIKFIMEDLKRGVCGCKEDFKRCLVREQRVLAEELLALYQTADYISCLIRAANALLPYCEVLIRDDKEIVFYMREAPDRASEEKTRLIIQLFLPIHVRSVIHWTYSYGVVGYGETMRLEEFVI